MEKEEEEEKMEKIKSIPSMFSNDSVNIGRSAGPRLVNSIPHGWR